jgi:hypothetical protein
VFDRLSIYATLKVTNGSLAQGIGGQILDFWYLQ